MIASITGVSKPMTVCALRAVSSTSVATASTSRITLRMRLRNHHRRDIFHSHKDILLGHRDEKLVESHRINEIGTFRRNKTTPNGERGFSGVGL